MISSRFQIRFIFSNYLWCICDLQGEHFRKHGGWNKLPLNLLISLFLRTQNCKDILKLLWANKTEVQSHHTIGADDALDISMMWLLYTRSVLAQNLFVTSISGMPHTVTLKHSDFRWSGRYTCMYVELYKNILVTESGLRNLDYMMGLVRPKCHFIWDLYIL